MDNYKTPHSTPQKEHLFLDDAPNKKEINTDFIKIVNEKSKGNRNWKKEETEEMYQRAWHEGEKEGRKKEIRKNRDKQKKNKNRKIAHVIVCLIAILAIFIYKFLKIHFENFRYLWFIAWIGGIIAVITKCIWPEIKHKSQIKARDDFWLAIVRVLYDIYKVIRGNAAYSFLVVLAIVMIVGGIGGEYNVDVHTKNAIKAFFENTIEDNEVKELEKTLEDTETESKIINDELEPADDLEKKLKNTTDNKEEEEKIVDSETGALFVSEYENDFPVAIEDMGITLDEKDMQLNLSEDEKGIIFFMEGDYCVNDWDNQEEINKVVREMVKNEHNKGLMNIFDKEAPETICGEVEAESIKEESADSFSEVEDIINVRKRIYSNYPKKDFPNLISSGNQRLALILIGNGGRQNTILYFYGQSILWDFEYLRYKDVSDTLLKDRLNRIATRYRDIANICVDCEEAEYAKCLEVAFEEAKKQY